MHHDLRFVEKVMTMMLHFVKGQDVVNIDRRVYQHSPKKRKKAKKEVRLVQKQTGMKSV